jgi:hypothetical protein
MEDEFGNRIVFAEQEKVSLYSFEMKRVLAAVAFFMSDDPEKWLKKVWVSDMSSIGDFDLGYEDVVKLAETLDVPVGQDEYLWRVAQMIHERRSDGRTQ